MKKLIFWFQIRALEATSSGREVIRMGVTDALTLANMDLAQHVLDTEIDRLKREFMK